MWKKYSFLFFLIKDIKEYIFVGVLNIKFVINKIFIDIWVVFFYYNDYVVIFYVVGVVVVGVDIDVGFFLKV